jgi:glutaminase
MWQQLYPRLAKVSPNKFGFIWLQLTGRFWVGDSDEKFLFKVFQSVNRRFGLFFGMKEYGKE